MDFSYGYYWGVCALSKSLPRSLSYAVARPIADAFYRWDDAGREAVKANLRTILGAGGVAPTEEAVCRTARDTFRNFGKYLADFFRYRRPSDVAIQPLFRLDGIEHYRQAVALNRGVLALSAHLGNWEMSALVLHSLGHQLNAVVLPQRRERVERLLARYRARRGARLLPLGRGTAAAIVSCLNRREFVGLLADKDFTTHNRQVPFFGRPTRLPHGPAVLAIKTGAPILPAFIIRRDDDGFLVRFYPPILARPDDSAERLQMGIARVLEEVIGEFPAQWFMFTDFWAGPPRPSTETQTAAAGAA
jgi:KDO2-lipid IV(A) lauroyltransferase